METVRDNSNDRKKRPAHRIAARSGTETWARQAQIQIKRTLAATATGRSTPHHPRESVQVYPNNVLRCSQDFPASFFSDDIGGVPFLLPAAPPRRRWNPPSPGAGDRPARRRFRGSSSALLTSATAACHRLIGRKRSLRMAPERTRSRPATRWRGREKGS